MHVVRPRRDYARRIKNKTRGGRDSSPSSTGPKAEPAVAPLVAPDELQRLKDELQRVNQQLSKIGLTRPGSDAARQTRQPEKQGLIAQKLDLERKLRALSRL